MNLITLKYPNVFVRCPSDWTARTILGGLNTLDTIWWSRKTYGTDIDIWMDGWYDMFGWTVIKFGHIEVEMTSGLKPHPGVSRN